MNLFTFLFIITIMVNGLLAGVSFDVAFVKLPTRRRIGNIAYAHFARGNDLGNGKIVYPILGIGSALLVVITTVVVYINHQSSSMLMPLIFATITTIIHSFCTAKAAPVMLSIKDTPDENKILKKKFDEFEHWHELRTIFQLLTFFALLLAFI